jgi:hypothetical protein
MNLRTAGGDGAKVSTVPFAIDRVWGAVPQVFDSLAIPIGKLDPATHVIGHNGFKITRKLGKVSLTRLLDCGNTQGSPSADTYEIQLSITTQLTAGAAGTTKVATLVEAVGRPMAFAGEYVKCSTKGNLETMITDALNARLTS